MGSGSPTHWRIASVVGKDEDLLPRRSAAIIGAATQLLLVLLRSYSWCCYHGGSAGRHTDLEDVRTTADQQGGIQILILVCVCSLPLASVNIVCACARVLSLLPL